MEAFLKSGAVLSCGPDRVRIAWGEPRRSATPGSVREASVFAPDFFLRDEKPWRIFPESAQMTRAELARRVQGLATGGGTEARFRWKGNEPQAQTFLSSFDGLQRRISTGELRKGVPVVFEAAEGVPTSAELVSALLTGLRARENAGRIYGIWSPGVSSAETEGMIGITPEDLFMVWPDGILETMALAGTARLEDAEELLSDSKELEEHQLVIDDLVARLSRAGEVSIDETEVARLPSLAHLKTAIQARLSDVAAGFSDLVRLLHPTPALGAFPREAGWKWLLSEEASSPVPRDRFGAPFGWVEDTDRICVVAIRNIQWRAGRTLLGSGCGVVAKSDPDREWAELALKRVSVRRALGLAGTG